jgi:transposase InsO family protein
LARKWARDQVPAASTIGEILKRHDLVHPRRRVRRNSPFATQLREYSGPNVVWCADFKGHFGIGKKRCHPLTITDGFSRYLLCCQALRRPLHGHVKEVFEAVFREYGLPQAIRTDNGSPFSSLALAGLSRLAVWWIRLGVRPERIMPGRPDQNGRHERMHSTLKAETANPPRSSFNAQQRTFDRFRLEYNEERPHEALDQQVPASRYRPSLRKYPTYLPKIEYPARFETRLVYPNGVFSFFNMTQWYASVCLAGERVGLEPCADGCWRVHYGFLPIGTLDLRAAMERQSRQFGRLDPIREQTQRRPRPPYGR